MMWLFLFLPELFGRTARRALVLGQVFLVSREILTEALYDLGVIAREVLGFPNILLQIKQFPALQFPFSTTHGLRAVEESLVRALRSFVPLHQRQQVLPVDYAVVWHLGAGDSGAGGEEVHAGSHFGALLAGRNATRPPHHGGDTHAALKAGELIAFERMGESSDPAVHVALHP